MKNWIQYKISQEKKGRLRKLADILDVILADEDIGAVIEQDVDQNISNVMLPSFIKNIRQELEVLQQDVPVFGK